MRRIISVAFVLMLVLGTQEQARAQTGGKVYWMATADIELGKISEYHAFAAKELIPLQKAHGYNIIGAWQTIVGDVEQAILVAEFVSMQAYHQARASLFASKEWPAVAAKFDGYAGNVRTRFMNALPYSKIK